MGLNYSFVPSGTSTTLGSYYCLPFIVATVNQLMKMKRMNTKQQQFIEQQQQ